MRATLRLEVQVGWINVQHGIDMMEQSGEMKAGEARRWKEGIYGLMVLWGLEPGDVVGA